MSTRIGGFVLVLLATAPATPARASQEKSRETSARHFPADEDLGLMLRYMVEDGETAGIVLGLLEPDGSKRVLFHGDAGPGARPLGPRSVFEIGSINKTFTGTLLADMAARGEVALDDPISKYLPEGVSAPRGEREITLLDLATHQSGLPRMADNHVPSDRGDPYADYTLETLYAFLGKHELRREPGAKGEYSNLGVGLLGHLLARAGGKSYRELLRERVLDPLGMDTTRHALEGDVAEWMTRGHAPGGEVVPHWFCAEAIDGAGGLRSNAEDMLRYLEANVAPPDTDLGRAMLAAREPRAPLVDGVEIGLNWVLREEGGRTLVQHSGSTGGFSANIGFDPVARVGFVQLSNSNELDDDIGLDLLRRGAAPAIPEVEVPAELLRSYAGTYELSPKERAVVRLEEEGWLTVRLTEQVRWRMHAESETDFFLKRNSCRLSFARDDAGKVTELVLVLEDAERVARRVE